MQRPAAAAMTRRPIEQQTNVIVLFAFQPGGGSSSDKWVLGATASSATEFKFVEGGEHRESLVGSTPCKQNFCRANSIEPKLTSAWKMLKIFFILLAAITIDNFTPTVRQEFC